ncbi:hypothetical protein N9Y60_00625 [Crocinitomicaceae bacterium]|nr:hypothetical protein [Crocinitomicaceae bacterium]
MTIVKFCPFILIFFVSISCKKDKVEAPQVQPTFVPVTIDAPYGQSTVDGYNVDLNNDGEDDVLCWATYFYSSGSGTEEELRIQGVNGAEISFLHILDTVPFYDEEYDKVIPLEYGVSSLDTFNYSIDEVHLAKTYAPVFPITGLNDTNLVGQTCFVCGKANFGWFWLLLEVHGARSMTILNYGHGSGTNFSTGDNPVIP